MGQAILYCFKCSTQLREAHFEQGKAYRVDAWVCCASCAPELMKTLSPDRVPILLNLMAGKCKKPAHATPPPMRDSRLGITPAALPHSSAKPPDRPPWPLISAGGLGLAALFLIIVLMTRGGSPPAAPGRSTRTAGYGGETLFRGLFFRQGTIGQQYPSLSIAPTAPTGQGAQVLDTLIAKMRATDPQFFNRFAAGIQSGSRIRILGAIHEAQTVFDNALIAAYHATAVATNGQIGYCFFGPIAVAVALVLVLAGAGVVVVAAAAAAVVVWAWFWAPAGDSASRLAEEKWVNKIALSPIGQRLAIAA